MKILKLVAAIALAIGVSAVANVSSAEAEKYQRIKLGQEVCEGLKFMKEGDQFLVTRRGVHFKGKNYCHAPCRKGRLNTLVDHPQTTRNEKAKRCVDDSEKKIACSGKTKLKNGEKFLYYDTHFSYKGKNYCDIDCPQDLVQLQANTWQCVKWGLPFSEYRCSNKKLTVPQGARVMYKNFRDYRGDEYLFGTENYCDAKCGGKNGKFKPDGRAPGGYKWLICTK